MLRSLFIICRDNAHRGRFLSYVKEKIVEGPANSGDHDTAHDKSLLSISGYLPIRRERPPRAGTADVDRHHGDVLDVLRLQLQRRHDADDLSQWPRG